MIGVYYKPSLPCNFKAQLTKLNETLVFHVKIGTRNYFFTSIYRNPPSEKNSKNNVDHFINELNITLDDIKGNHP